MRTEKNIGTDMITENKRTTKQRFSTKRGDQKAREQKPPEQVPESVWVLASWATSFLGTTLDPQLVAYAWSLHRVGNNPKEIVDNENMKSSNELFMCSHLRRSQSLASTYQSDSLSFQSSSNLKRSTPGPNPAKPFSLCYGSIMI